MARRLAPNPGLGSPSLQPVSREPEQGGIAYNASLPDPNLPRQRRSDSLALLYYTYTASNSMAMPRRPDAHAIFRGKKGVDVHTRLLGVQRGYAKLVALSGAQCSQIY